MAKKKAAKLPLEPLADLLAWWRKARVPGMIIGGLAVSLLARARTTRDVDAVILLDESRWRSFLALGETHHFKARIDDALAFARTSRVFLLHHSPSKIDIDLSIGSLSFEKEALSRVQQAKVGLLRVPLASPADLVILKAVAHRPQDMIDIVNLLEIHPDLDKAHIRKWVDEFAQLLEMPEIYLDLDRLLKTTSVNR